MRNLLLLPELARKYGVTTINVAYEAKHADAEPINRHPDTNKPYYTLPIALDVLIKNKVYLAYDDETDTIARPDYLIGVGNHWLQTLTDDHKNRRIDINQYTIRH
jgi:phosphoribulokinase